MALLVCAPAAAAGQAAPIPAPAPPPADSVAGRAVPLLEEADLVARASVHALTAPLRWRAREWMLAGGSVAGVAIASIADEDGRHLMAEIRTERHTRVEAWIEPFGAEGSLALLGGMLAAGLALDDARLRMTAAEGLAASLIAAGIVTPTLQAVIGRSKPRDGMPAYTFDPFGGPRSHPSGHTTQAFAVASVIAAEYDHPLVQTGAYGMAVAVGVSRMYRRSHFVSDVVGGAIIGTTVGQAVARFGQGRRGAISVSPWMGSDGGGLVVSRRF